VKSAEVKVAAKAALHQWAELVHTRAVPYTPIDTGNLRASYDIFDHPDRLAVVIENTAPYALFVHEMTGMVTSEPGTYPKYLKIALDETEREGLEIVKSAVGGAIG
jgi:hypothetical protein